MNEYSTYMTVTTYFRFVCVFWQHSTQGYDTTKYLNRNSEIQSLESTEKHNLEEDVEG